MIAKINSITYDTSFAERLGSYTNRQSPLENDCVAENLYRKLTGEYFLHAFGGGCTKYGYVYRNGECRAGFKIIPLTAEEAKAWMLKRMDALDYKRFL